MCWSPLDIKEGQTVCECKYCGTSQTVHLFDNGRKDNLYNRANELRYKCEFDKSSGLYETIVTQFPNEAEAYWGLVLSKYGIEYVDDPRTGEKVPTCHRTLFTSIFEDADYKHALEYADDLAKPVYEEEAKEIDRIQKHIIKISQKEDPYDIFICYKETDENNSRTPDSVLAHDIYDKLVEKQYKVFFARVTLEGKLGQEYEPIIFAALRSAKVMLVVGTKREYFNAVWVKNEWSRFLSFMKDDKDKFLVPCYKDIDVYDMPEEFLPFQSQDLSKLGYIQDLTRGIDKLFGRDNPNEKVIIKEATPNNDLANFYSRIDTALSQRQFDKAEWILEEVFEIAPDEAKAYFYHLLITKRYSSVEDLLEAREAIDSNSDYQKALELADVSYKETLISYANTIKNNIYKDQYAKAMRFMNQNRYQEAIQEFSKIEFYLDAKKMIEKCHSLIKENKYAHAKEEFNKKNYQKAKPLLEELGSYKDCPQLLDEIENESKLTKANNIVKAAIINLNKKNFDEGMAIFESIKLYKNVPELMQKYEKEFQSKLTRFNNKKKRKVTLFAIIGSSLLLLVAFFIVLGTVIVPSSQYNQAIELINAGNYRQADNILENLNWKDSKKQLKLNGARRALENGDYETAIDVACSIDGQAKLEYVCDKGTFERKYDTVTNASSFELPKWTYGGYHLTYWNVDYYNIDTSNYIVYITLRASYDITQFSIFLCENSENQITNTINYNVNQSVPIDNPTREGYTFLGWQGGPYTSPTKDITIPKGTYQDMKLVAKWQINQYQITYYLNGGTSSNPSTYTIEDSFALNSATKTGYTFEGWFLDGGYSRNVSAISHQTGNINLYAKFTANTYTYTLDANGGTLENPVKNIKVTYHYNYNDSVETYSYSNGSTIPFKSAERHHYKLIGWCTDSELNHLFSFNEAVTKDIDLYAKWEYSEYDFLYYTKKISKSYSSSVDENYATNTYTYIAAGSGSISGSFYYSFPSSNTSTLTLYLSIYNKTTSTSIYSGYIEKTSTYYSGTVEKDDVISFTIKSYEQSYSYVYWPEVTISVNSPSFSYPSSSAYASLADRVTEYVKEYTYDSQVTLPTPIRDGYTFMGWKFNNQTITNLNIQNWNIAQSGTLLAVWQ